MSSADLEQQLYDLKKKYDQTLDRIHLYEAKSNAAQTAYEGCQSSASYKLGHLLIHETKTFKDVLKLFQRINKIRKISRFDDLKPLKHTAKKQNNIDPKFKLHTSLSKKETFKDGISVILPTYKGEETILRVLTSLAKQDLSDDLFEVITIINGEQDNTKNLISMFSKENPNLNIRTFVLNDNGASLARNKGIDEIRYKYTTLIDDDDSVSPTYLSAMYNLAAENTIVLSQIINIDENTIDASNVINMQILKSDPEKDNLFVKCPSVLTINACKLIPSKYIKQIKFDTSLRSAEDIVYFSELFSKFSFQFKIAKEAIYFRYMKHNSVSRQPLSFTFNVQERLEVISKVFNALENTHEKDIRSFLQQKISAQISFVNIYLREFPDEYDKVLTEIKKNDLHSFPYNKLQKKDTAKSLIISYCFTPYVDTSAIVMAKRIREKNEIIDVVYNNMNSVRARDERLNALADELVETRIDIDTPTSFNQWNEIEAFSKKMIEKLQELKKPSYETIYSRVMWPASNFAAFEYKLNNPTSQWIAEFSDPILFDIHGEIRYSKITGEWHYKEIEKLLQAKNLSIPKSDNLFFWCEYLAYVFADELIFTNKHQLSYMLGKTEQELHTIIEKKAIIKSHPTLPKKYYELRDSYYPLKKEKIHLAYFGAFYQTRKLNDIVEVIKALPETYKEKVMIHVFTNVKDELEDLILKENLTNNFTINDYISYFEFLNLTTKFDCLILNDAITKPEKKYNPYLPSKLSDYKGSGTDIWALYEKDSIISQSKDIKYKSELGKINESCQVIEKIIDDHYKVDKENLKNNT